MFYLIKDLVLSKERGYNVFCNRKDYSGRGGVPTKYYIYTDKDMNSEWCIKSLNNNEIQFISITKELIENIKNHIIEEINNDFDIFNEYICKDSIIIGNEKEYGENVFILKRKEEYLVVKGDWVSFVDNKDKATKFASFAEAERSFKGYTEYPFDNVLIEEIKNIDQIKLTF